MTNPYRRLTAWLTICAIGVTAGCAHSPGVQPGKLKHAVDSHPVAARLDLDSGEMVTGRIIEVLFSEGDTTVIVDPAGEDVEFRTIDWQTIRRMETWRSGAQPKTLIAIGVVFGLLIYATTRPTKRFFPTS